ncbi:glycerophosphodiester phosphodiesterase [Algivirga pacifica]|uniref:Glycerophosphodiester phosphodiesterase n=2 Tax=Algivirga pacifica TaxID=1162670 RepID=A0ABP9DFY9_9BACT
MLVAHRGASADAPENTLAAVQLAWEQDADAVEIDIHLSKDGRVMVHHDKDTKRTANGPKKYIKETNSTALRSIDVGTFKGEKYKGEKYKGEKIPFLEEVLATIPEEKHLVIEIKSGMDVVPAMTSVIKNSEKEEQVIFISFDFEAIVQTKKSFPDNKALYLCHYFEPFGTKKLFHKVKEAGLDGLDLNYKIIDSSVMELADLMDLEIHAYTVNELTEAKRLIALGVKSITTDQPAKLRAVISDQ